MAIKRGLRIFAVAVILVVPACSEPAVEATCATGSGARVCVTQKKSAVNYEVKATGFKPNSDVQMITPEGASAGSHPMELRVGADGTYSNKGGVLGMVGGPGTPATITLMFSGTAESGVAVTIPVVMKG